MSDQSDKLRWGAERRQEFIEFRLFWDGSVGRMDVADFFGVSSVQASKDISFYQESAPDNLSYDTVCKRHVRSDSFEPKLLKPDAARYLAELRSLAEEVISKAETWVSNLPPFDVIPTPSRSVDPVILRPILEAIHSGSATEVLYQSMSRTTPKKRWITPHALGFDGFRWHARSFCHQDKCFKDFVVARILECGETKPHGIEVADDRDWVEKVNLVIAPHPDLSHGQKKVVELDYGMEDGSLTIPTRRAFVYYLKKRLGLDIDPNIRNPKDQHIVLVNADEVDRQMEVANVG
jgi:predicted DNA-binding transcriptional regulator YafY